jgi:Flp pilus assembly protein TadD
MNESTTELPGLNLRVIRFRTEPEREEPALLTQALIDSGRADEALELAADALARDPRDPDLHLVYGVALSRLGRLEEAQRALVRAARLAPDWAEPLRHLAEVLLRRNRAEQALAVADKALAMDTDDPALATLRRSALLSVRALRFVRGMSDDEPVMLAQELMACGLTEAAFEVTRTALIHEVDDVDLLVTHARAARARGDLEGALGALTTAAFEAPDWPEIERLVAEIRAELASSEQALAAEPSHAPSC